MVVYIQLDVAAAVVTAPVAAVFGAAAAETDVCAGADVGECARVAQAGAYAEVSGKSVRN